MTAGLVGALALAALPAGSARYRFEIGGEQVGVADLAIRCAATGCTAVWETTTRLPAEAGGATRLRRSTAEVDRAGRFRRGGAVLVEERGEVRRWPGRPGAVASSVAEVVLAAETPGRGERCIEILDDHGIHDSACARRGKGTIAMVLPGGHVDVLPGEDGFPEAVDVRDQGVRFIRDPAAAVPAAAPRLYGSRVRGPAVSATANWFSGIWRDPPAAAVDASRLPPPRAEGESCREKTLDYLTRAARAGIAGRAAAGVAFDGTGFVWHAWAELRVGDAWVAIDPAFGQSPAEGPRFTVARWIPGDGAQEEAAGRRILMFWGRARVGVLKRRPMGLIPLSVPKF